MFSFSNMSVEESSTEVSVSHSADSLMGTKLGEISLTGNFHSLVTFFCIIPFCSITSYFSFISQWTVVEARNLPSMIYIVVRYRFSSF